MKSDTSDTSETRDDSAPAKPGRTPIEPSRRDAVEDWLTLFVRMLGLPASETEAVRDELEDHLRSRVDDLLITGVSEPEAVRRAVAELGETATLAQGFRKARRRPRRRIAMHAALFAVAGSALVLSSTALYSGGGTNAVMPMTQPEVVAIEGEPAEIAPFNENLRRYDISALMPRVEQQVVGYQPSGAPYYLPTDRHDDERIDEITYTIYTLVDSERWENNGGDEARVLAVGTTLFVEAPPEMHEGVLWVLQSLRQDVDRARAEADRANEEAARARVEAERTRHVEAEDQRREREMRIERDIAELEKAYQELTDRVVKHEEEKVLLEMQEDALRKKYSEDPSSEDAQKQLAEIRGRLVRLGIEQDTAQSRMVATRELLTALQFQQYASFAPGAPGVPTAPSPAGGSPFDGGEVSRSPTPSGRSGR